MGAPGGGHWPPTAVQSASTVHALGAILGAGPLGPVVKHRVVQLGGELVLVTRLGGEGFKVVSVRVMYWLCEAASVSAGYPTPPAQLPPEKCGLGLPL